MLIEQKIRKLAKNVKSMNLYTMAKDINSIQLFKNTIDFSQIQLVYLSYLYFYNSIFTAIAENKVKKYILKSEIYEDAYMAWVRKNKDIKSEKTKGNKFYGKVSHKINFPKNNKKEVE